MMQCIGAFLAHFRDQTHGCQQDSVVLLIQKGAGGWNEHLHQIWHFADDAEGTQDCLKIRTVKKSAILQDVDKSF